MSFGRDTCVVLSNIVLDSRTGPPGTGRVNLGLEPPPPPSLQRYTAYRQITMVLVDKDAF